MFSVVLPEGDARQGRRRVGELDEEMVMESRVGDIIALGTRPWRIKELGADRGVVEAAPGRAARLPFWHGEAIGRPYETGRARGALVRALDGGIARAAERDEALVEHVEEGTMAPALRDRLTADGLDEDALRNLAALIEAQRACTGAVPTDRRLVVEACPDETGDMRVILHSPFGRRVHEPWALAVAHRITSTLGFDPQAVASDDGIVLRVPAAEDALPGSDLFRFDSDELESIVRERVGERNSVRINSILTDIIAHSGDGVLKMSPEMQQAVDVFTDFMYQGVYYNPIAKGEERKVQNILGSIWEYYVRHIDELPAVYQSIADEEGAQRAVCDYVSGMTDSYALEVYSELFIPAAWTIK